MSMKVKQLPNIPASKITESTTKKFTNDTAIAGIDAHIANKGIHKQASKVTITGKDANAEGSDTKAIGDCSHAEGSNTKAKGHYSHTEGGDTTANGNYSHAEGRNNLVNGESSHAEGINNLVNGEGSHVEGANNMATYSRCYKIVQRFDDSNVRINPPIADDYTYNMLAYIICENGGCISVNITDSDGSSGEFLSFNRSIPPYARYVIVPIEGMEMYNHAEGVYSFALNTGSHAEGISTIVMGEYSHVEGSNNVVIGSYSHAEGDGNELIGWWSHAEGQGNTVTVASSHVEGRSNLGGWGGVIPISSYSGYTINLPQQVWIYNGQEVYILVNGDYIKAIVLGSTSDYSIEIQDTYGNPPNSNWHYLVIPDGDNSTNGPIHLEGVSNFAYGNMLHVEGAFNKAIMSDYSHVEGCGNISKADYTHIEGRDNTVTNQCAHAEGSNTKAEGVSAHAEGGYTKANGNFSHAEGFFTTVQSDSAHAEGYYTQANGYCAHSEGNYTQANGNYAHSEGNDTQANGSSSHAEGSSTTASGIYSHTEGYCTKADNYCSHVMGRYNKKLNGNATTYVSTSDAFVIGNGANSGSLANAFRVTFDGKTYGLSAFNSTGADYAEYFEWLDGNIESEDRVGYFVTLDGDKIRKSTEADDYILGIISATPSIVGDNYADDWNGKYITDDWGRVQYHDVVIPTTYRTEHHNEEYGFTVVEPVLDEDGIIVTPRKQIRTLVKEAYDEQVVDCEEHIEHLPVLNPDWDSSAEYIPRERRREWSAVGIVGKLLVRDDGTCQVNGYCKSNNEGIATSSTNGYRVMKRMSPNIIQVFFEI